mgnify:CR=1 FL=1
MILLTNGDSWTQGDSPSQTLNWNATKTLDWYDIVPHFGNALMSPDNRIFKSEKNTRISYKFYDKVQKGYLKIAKSNSKSYKLIDSNLDQKKNEKIIKDKIDKLIK